MGQNNLRIINLFLRRSQEHQTDFHITFKYYVSLGVNRDLGLFGEFPHIENSILVLAVNYCIYERYANYVSELCSFGDIFSSKLKNVRVLKLPDICSEEFEWKIANIFAGF